MDDEGDNLSQGTAKPVPASLDKSASESDGMVEEAHSSVLEPSGFDFELSPPGSVDIADTRNFFGTSEASRELNDFLDGPDADYLEVLKTKNKCTTKKNWLNQKAHRKTVFSKTTYGPSFFSSGIALPVGSHVRVSVPIGFQSFCLPFFVFGLKTYWSD